jgi:antagonist of KipI
VLEVVEPGPQATIQDGGRPGYGHLGVPTSGACDRWSLAAANLMLGNVASSPAAEIALGGFEAVAVEDCTIGLAGADLGAHVDGRRVPTLAVHLLRRGKRLALPGASGGPTGARAYIALAGGLDVEAVLGSASTYALAGLGGIDGRALRAGDRLAPASRGDLSAAGRSWPASIAPPTTRSGRIGVVPGPDLHRLPTGSLQALVDGTWTVSAESDRMGVRLDGRRLATAGEVVSQPMVGGAIQLPADGRPIVLLADHQTVGGYPVVAVVIEADQPRLGQARAGDELGFEAVTLAEARARRALQGSAMRSAAVTLRGDAVWDRLADDAGA